MAEAHVSKRVLETIAASHPEEGDFAVRRVEIARGWGDVLNVTICAQVDRSAAGVGQLGSRGHSEQARVMRRAVERALAPERCRVSLVELD